MQSRCWLLERSAQPARLLRSHGAGTCGVRRILDQRGGRLVTASSSRREFPAAPPVVPCLPLLPRGRKHSVRDPWDGRLERQNLGQTVPRSFQRSGSAEAPVVWVTRLLRGIRWFDGLGMERAILEQRRTRHPRRTCGAGSAIGRACVQYRLRMRGSRRATRDVLATER